MGMGDGAHDRAALPVRARVPSQRRFPPSMRAAVLRALSKNKEERQASVTAFYEELAGSAPVASGAHTGTAAMAAPPVFDAPGPAKTAAMPSPIASGPSTAQAAAPGGADPGAPTRRQQGSRHRVGEPRRRAAHRYGRRRRSLDEACGRRRPAAPAGSATPRHCFRSTRGHDVANCHSDRRGAAVGEHAAARAA